MTELTRIQRQQVEFFRRSLDARHRLQHFNDNLFIPLSGDDLDAFNESRGQELADKMKAVYSSSALCVNFFLRWKIVARQPFLRWLGELIFRGTVIPDGNSNILFEASHQFGSTEQRRLIGDVPDGQVDVDLRFDAAHVALVESKFTEKMMPFSRTIHPVNIKRYAKAFEECFDCAGTELLPDGRWCHLYQLAQRLLYTVDNKEHVFASTTYRAMVFLHYETPESLAAANEFMALVKPSHRHYIRIMTYQELFRAAEARFEGERVHAAWFHYMKQRYFAH